MTYHHIQCLLYVFALFNLASCTHQSAIKSSTLHIGESNSPSQTALVDAPVINPDNSAAKNAEIAALSAETKQPVYSIVVYAIVGERCQSCKFGTIGTHKKLSP